MAAAVLDVSASHQSADKSAATIAGPSDGRLVLASSGALYLLDVRAPRVQAAVPYDTGAVMLDRGQLIISDGLGFRSYAADLENMVTRAQP